MNWKEPGSMFNTHISEEERLARQLELVKAHRDSLQSIANKAKALSIAIAKALEDGDTETALTLTQLLTEVL